MYHVTTVSSNPKSFKYLYVVCIAEEAAHTASFIEKLDQLFNAFNSQTRTSKAKMRHAISTSSGHVEFLETSLKWIEKIKTKGENKIIMIIKKLLDFYQTQPQTLTKVLPPPLLSSPPIWARTCSCICIKTKK